MKNLFLLILLFCGLPFIAIAQHDYTDALYKTTYFYGAQRCGNTQSWSHAACHTLDGSDVGLDLTGGWHDCGDHIKFGHTGPFTAIVLLMGYEASTPAYDDTYSPTNSAPPSNSIPDILDEVKFLTDYLIKTVSGNTIYYQVGDFTDHASFHDPAWQSANLPQSEGGDPRTTYSFTTGGANVAGAAASALALMSMNYTAHDASYAATCLTKAVEYYNIGKANTGSIPATSSSGGSEYYPAGNWADEMALAAIHLYRATGTNTYLTEAEGYYNDADFAVADWQPLITTYVNQFVHYELYQATGTAAYLNRMTDHMSEMYFHPDNCGYMHFADWGSLYYAADAAFIASLYHKLTGSATAYNFAKSNVDFSLGTHGFVSTDAPANHSFVIGYNALGGGYSEHPHDATSFGKEANAWNLLSQETNNPGSVPYDNPLIGALVGGPRSLCSNYIDNIDDYQGNETCTYYNSGLVSAIAYVKAIENGLLPVEWIEQLSAKKEVDKIELRWHTALEDNADYFAIERSFDGKNWVEIGIIRAKGSNSIYKTYDTSPKAGQNFYRLRQVDFDGKFDHSNVVSLVWEEKQFTIHISPNPFTKSTKVEFSTPINSVDYQVYLYNANGELLKSLAPKNTSYFEVKRENLPEGIYFLQGIGQTGILFSEKLIIR